jgi:hypothetical protein
VTTQRRRRVLIVAALVAVLLFAELSSRALAPHLADPLRWHSPEAQRKVAQMNARARAGGVDLAFVGSSIVRNAVDPDLVVHAFGNHLRGYNAGLTAGTPDLMEPWTLDVVLPRLHPRVLVIGVNSFDFSDSAAADAFYQAFVSSPDARRAMGRDDLGDRINRWLTDRSSLWDYRDSLRKPTDVIDAIRGDDPPPDPDAAGTDVNGRETYLQDGLFDQRVQGVGLPVNDWALGTKRPAALERLINATKTRGIAVALVDMPVTAEYVSKHPHGEADYDTFRRALRDLAVRTSTPLVELDSVRDHTYFRDEVHLNLGGAEFFSRTLGAALASNPSLPALAGG